GTLRDYQVFVGATGLAPKFSSSATAAILADENGPGQTLQTVAFLLGLHGGRRRGGVSGRSLIVCPLSVLNNCGATSWPSLRAQLTVRVYTGDKAERGAPAGRAAAGGLDPAALNVSCRFILTGTPIQNNLDELFTLLSFVAPKVFRLKLKDQFHCRDSGALYEILKPFLLRRIKEDVLKSLPKKVETHSTLCNRQQSRLLNIQMQLRKCINHPYLFDGELSLPAVCRAGRSHSSQASTWLLPAPKLILIDRLLKYLKANGHKVLMFSQMTHMLDILQDYLTYRVSRICHAHAQASRTNGLTAPSEARSAFLAVKNFNQTAETFVFLLSTRGRRGWPESGQRRTP
uniref:SNF2_N domain-containing protein n=1 Tax=Macrostomum lignano TaxID=282301 RepID=A0A1I8FI37_9PLAT